MNKKIIVFITFIFELLLLFLIPNDSFAANGYTIESYDINMVVNENNTFDITETITANFETNKHGIIRNIPLKNTIKRLDGSTSRNTAKITNLKVNDSYVTSSSNGNFSIKIGDSSQYVIGSKTYVIKYTYDIGADTLKGADELYYNLIGDSWDTSISNISFSITMPKEFDSSSLGFSSGDYGSTNSSNVSYNVVGNTITGYYNTTLPPENALTVRLTLPDNYFVGAHNNNLSYYIIIIAIIIIVIISIILWFIFGKDAPLVETIEFYPPEGYNSAELAFLYKGDVDNEAIISLLIYLADQGYLEIEELQKKVLFSNNNDFIITKLKDYDGENEVERIFFNGLFRTGDAVTSLSLTNSFYLTVNEIKRLINKKENRYKIYEKTSLTVKKLLIPLVFLIYLLITFKPFYDTGMMDTILGAIIFPPVGFSVAFTGLLSNKSASTKIFFIFWGLLFGGIPFLMIVAPVVFSSTISGFTYIFGIIAILALMALRKIMVKRTRFGLDILGKIKGFKRFLETAEKDQLESLVKEHPKYFYDILPYTYALGVSDTWIKQFENIALEPPQWYYSSTGFNMHSFNTFMSSTMTSVTRSMTSSPSSSSGGSSSGGGSSGGGSGGGGGSSW